MGGLLLVVGGVWVVAWVLYGMWVFMGGVWVVMGGVWAVGGVTFGGSKVKHGRRFDSFYVYDTVVVFIVTISNGRKFLVSSTYFLIIVTHQHVVPGTPLIVATQHEFLIVVGEDDIQPAVGPSSDATHGRQAVFGSIRLSSSSFFLSPSPVFLFPSASSLGRGEVVEGMMVDGVSVYGRQMRVAEIALPPRLLLWRVQLEEVMVLRLWWEEVPRSLPGEGVDAAG